jgi:predicted amidohydrolase YtcJ
MHDKANGLARRGFLQFMDDDQRKAAARRVCEIAASKGVTTIGAMEGGQWGSEADVDAIISSKLPCDVLVYWDTFDIEAAKAKGLTRIGADITLDGSIGSRTAAFEEPYADAPDRSGVLYYDAKQITQYIYDCYENNLQTGFHVIGRLAIKQALDCLEEAGVGTRHRLRMEHFGYPTDEDIERCAKLGAVISTQSAFTYFRGGPGSVYLERLGAERERNGYPLRKFLNAGIIVGNGSDSDVTPIDPILGIYAAVNPPYPENAITPYEALKAATIDAAYISGEETKKGSLAVGKLGDLTVLDADILKNLNKNINVFATIKNGEYAYGGN